jgi:cytochrome c-type biogenesis protein CcmF
MMGAAWAYESLTFGGFWAWDPVENASLVPWLLMISGLHTQLSYNATGHSLRATYLFLILGFFFVLFSTFLTRSGILGDSSVHAFVESGINVQLFIFMMVFLLPALWLFVKNYRNIPHIVKEETTNSREFWMFIGSLVLFLSAIVITWQTAFTPIYNKLRDKATAAPEDPEFSYNKIQIFVAIVISFLSATTQYLKYKNTDRSYFWKKMLIPVFFSAIISLFISFLGNLSYNKYGIGFLGAIHLALFTAVYTTVANAAYIWLVMKGNLKMSGASFAHLGFGLMLIGILISSSKKDVLSKNNGVLLPFDSKSKENPTENLTLIKGLRTDMGLYWATYRKSDSTNKNGNIIYFDVELEKKATGERFHLYPNLIKNTKGNENYSNNPDSKHYWNKDIFAYISYASTMDGERPDTITFRNYSRKPKDTIFYSSGYILFNKITLNPPQSKHVIKPGDTLVVADLTVRAKDNSEYKAEPAIYWKGKESRIIFDTIFAQSLAIAFTSINPENGQAELQVKESARMVPFVALKVYEFPQISLLWIGTIVMFTGFFISLLYRFRLYKAKNS